MTSAEDFEHAIEESHQALDEIARGDPSRFFDLFSRGDDATLANPYGPPARGRAQIEEAGRRAAANYRDGRAVKFENFATCVTAELAYMLEIERFEAKVAGAADMSPIAIRVTTVFRLESGEWKVVNRHADPIMSAQKPESLTQT